LTGEELAKLRDIFAAEPDVILVEAARKWVRIFPQSPFYVFSVRIHVPWWKPRSASTNQQLVNRLAPKIAVHGDCQIFVADKSLKSLSESLAAVPGAEIYRQGK
jgi:hypothetical protein